MNSVRRAGHLRACAWGIALVVLFAIRPAAAHDMRPGVLSLTERSPGDYALHFVPPIDTRGDASDVSIVVPAGCRIAGERVQCSGTGLRGELGIVGMYGPLKTIVVLVRASGERSEWILDSSTPRITVGGSPPSGFIAWVRLGVTHILTGFDHLAFVLSLLMVLQLALDRRLLMTITAFTIAHSVTLALAVLGVLVVRPAPVEACIALSVLLVAREALHTELTLIRRAPWMAAAAFGLIHGLGFASALREVGLPTASLARSLVAFNVGVEVGQLVVVVAVLVVVAVGRRLIGERGVVRTHIHRSVCYALGALAAWWLVERVVELARGAG